MPSCDLYNSHISLWATCWYKLSSWILNFVLGYLFSKFETNGSAKQIQKDHTYINVIGINLRLNFLNYYFLNSFQHVIPDRPRIHMHWGNKQISLMAFLLKHPQISVQVGQKHILSLISINVQQIQKTLRISLQKENYYFKNKW